MNDTKYKKQQRSRATKRQQVPSTRHYAGDPLYRDGKEEKEEKIVDSFLGCTKVRARDVGATYRTGGNVL